MNLLTETSLFKSSRWITALAGTLLIIGLVWWWRADIAALVQFLEDKGAISRFLEPLGMWGPLLYVALLALQVLTVIIPGHALMIAAGYVYGFQQGLLLNIIGGVGASQLAFVISRAAGQEFVQRVVPAGILYRWESIVRRQGMLFFMISFWFPLIPSNFTNYIAGTSPISFGRFFVANIVGRLPGMIFITLFGAYGLELSLEQWGMVAVAAMLAIIVGRYISAKLQQLYAPSSIQ
ncbi:MAG: hypothetical protein FOGNACKC_04453 [Anaerolineae bacterium]|nr:hypothetical protein [Anaerolineae bacterium]